MKNLKRDPLANSLLKNSENLAWRKNLHKVVEKVLGKLHPIIVDVIDSAWLSGFEQHQDIPMGVSQWMNYGEKWHYAEFWKKKIIKEYKIRKD